MLRLTLSHKGNEPIIETICDAQKSGEDIEMNIKDHIYNFRPMEGCTWAAENGVIISEFEIKVVSHKIPRG